MKNIAISIIVGIIFMSWWAYTPDIPLDQLKEKYLIPSSKFIKVQDMDVHYSIEGEGPILLLIHGTASSLHTWDGWTEQMKDSLTIVRMDLPAFGLTGAHPNRDYSLEAYVSFVDTFISALDILEKDEKFLIAGNSLGGAIAWNYAATYPDRVEKLILIDASGAPRNQAAPLIFKLARTPVISGILKNITPRSIIQSNLEEVYIDDSKITESLIDRYYELALRPGNRDAFIDRARLILAVSTELLSNISCPVLIQWGEADEWIPVSDAEYFNERLANSRVIIYPDAGHVPMEEIPEQTAQDALTFLLN